MDDLICAVLNADGKMRVDTDPAWPQYLQYDETTDTLSPMTQENSKYTRWNSNVFEALINQLKSFFRLLKSLVQK